MPSGQSLDEKISYLEVLLEDLRTAGQEANTTLMRVKRERKEMERLLEKNKLKELIDSQVEKAIDRWRKDILTETETARIGEEIDRLIDLALGEEFSTARGREDLRPALASIFGQWVRDLIQLEEAKR